jgi:hypothetical protein
MSLPNKKEDAGVKPPCITGEMISAWFVRDFCEWFHTKKVQMHQDQLKHNGDITWL